VVGLAVLAPAVSAATPAVPDARRLQSVRRYLEGRRGLESYAVIDTARRLHGLAPRRVYMGASVVKAMLLVAYLRKIGARAPSAAERGILGPMVSASDNARATAIYRRTGDGALRRLAKRAGMTRFSVAASWSYARFSAEDQARFMWRFDRLTPTRNRSYARHLLASIVPSQRWGFSRFALAAGWQTFFKGGWRRTGRGRLVHEVALLERGRQRFSLAVLTDGNPSMGYGAATLRGVAARLFE